MLMFPFVILLRNYAIEMLTEKYTTQKQDK